MASGIHVVGLGVESGGCLNRAAESALRNAEVIIGAERQLDWLQEMVAEPLPAIAILPKLTELEAMIEKYPGEIAILASGDPLYFGIGRWLGDRYQASQLHFYSAVSSVQAACSRLGLALQDCIVLSLHGRPLGSLKRYLHNGRRLIILTDRHSDPVALANICIEAGLERSRLWVCENLGTSAEKIHSLEVARVADYAHSEFSSLQVSVLELHGEGGLIPSFPGIDDTRLVTDGEPGQGMFSKREMRLQILSMLQVGEEQTVWDVGAGCGGVSTELALSQASARIYAVEQHPVRLQCLHANREGFGNLNLDIIAGRAPDVLADLPDPNRVFIGGSDGDIEALFDYCWQRLAAGGVLVASAVTEATQQQLESIGVNLGNANVDSVQIAITRGSLEEGQWQQRAKLPVTLFRFHKPGSET